MQVPKVRNIEFSAQRGQTDLGSAAAFSFEPRSSFGLAIYVPFSTRCWDVGSEIALVHIW